MLDQLESLDDAAPPAPDAALLAEVRGRAHRRRRRSRLAAVGSAIVVLVIAVGAGALIRDDARKVDVVGPTRPVPSGPVSEGRLPNGLRFRMTLDLPTVVLGDPVTATVAVENDTGTTQIIGAGRSVRCGLGIRTLLRSPSGDSMSINPTQESACTSGGFALSAGKKASFTASVPTDWVVFPTGKRAARYELKLVFFPHPPRAGITGSSPPLAVEIAAPDVTARIELTAPTVAPGGMVHGTIIFDNRSGKTVNATCVYPRGYGVWLAKNGVALNRPRFPAPGDQACPNQMTLPRGTTRFSFAFRAAYDTPSGPYEVVFEGWGPLSPVEVESVPIEVVPARP